MTAKLISRQALISLAAATFGSSIGSGMFENKIGGIVEQQLEFKNFLTKYGKSYLSKESYKHRFETFKQN